jgi:hypothetical protein
MSFLSDLFLVSADNNGGNGRKSKGGALPGGRLKLVWGGLFFCPWPNKFDHATQQ